MHVEWWDNVYTCNKSFKIEGFELEVEEHYEQGVYFNENDNLKLEIESIRPLVWDRHANMVISFLDRITVYGRVKKDDVGIVNQIQNFTLAQIVDLINVAQESKAVNVLAVLMDMKNSKFSGIDPMDEFTLEW